jgi:hypothetical protein
MRILSVLVLFPFVAAIGCGAQLVDCDALARDQAACMDEETIADCKATNAQCEESGGEVLVLESCPLQFACDSTSP